MIEDLEQAISWLSALDTGSEYGETNKEIILSKLEKDERVIKAMAKHIERFSVADFHNYGANADEWETYFRKKCE